MPTPLKIHTPEQMRAIRLIKAAIQEGYLISLYPEDDIDDPLHFESRDAEAIIEDLWACDMMTVRLTRKLQSGNGKRTVGATFALVYQGEDDEDGPISDHTDNDIGRRFFNIAYGLPLD